MNRIKKWAIISGAVSLACLIAGLMVLPDAVASVMLNSDKILGRFIQSTPLASYDGKRYAILNIDIENTDIRIEQSKDDNIYLRAEGLFMDQYQMASAEAKQGEATVLNISLNDNGQFYGEGTEPYLLKKRIAEEMLLFVVVRVPQGVSVVTTGSPWRVSYTRGVQFANRAYYENTEWQDEDDYAQGWSGGEGDASRMYEKYMAMTQAFESELFALSGVASQSGLESPLDTLADDADAIVERHRAAMQAELFPLDSEVYPRETLLTMLDNYLSLSGQGCKQQLLISQDGGEGSGMLDLAQNARDAFGEMYQKYIATIPFPPSSGAEGMPPEEMPLLEEEPMEIIGPSEGEGALESSIPLS